jgi:hypothetical protein
MATAAATLKVFRVLSATIVNMTLSFPLLRFGSGPADPDVLMCSSGVVVNYNTDLDARVF